MSDTFTSEIFAWLRQVFADKTLHPTAFKLAFAVSQYINRKTRKAFPSLPTLASAVGITTRAVINLIARLEANGHLLVERHRVRGRNRSNTYRLNIKKGDADDTFSDEKREVQRTKTCSPLHPNQPMNQPHRLGERPPPLRPAADAAPQEEEEEAFASFWRQYPKRQGKDAARRAFAEVIAKGADAQELVAGAMRYGAACIGKSDQYIAMPANWLRDGRWKDEPSAKQDNGDGDDNGGRRRRGKPSLAEEMLRAGGNDVGGSGS